MALSKMYSRYWNLQRLSINVLKQALLTEHVKHGYVYVGPITDMNMCYMVMQTLGFEWLKHHRGVMLVMSEHK